MSENDIITFTYKGGRKVKGKILKIYPKAISLDLMSDYYGANVDWYIGEKKDFNIAEMKEIKQVE